MRRIILILLLLVSIAGANAQIFTDGQLAYLITEPNKVSVSGYDKLPSELTIPESVEYEGLKYTVTAIEFQAFGYCSDLISVNIPNSVTNIGDNAFYYCKSLTSATIPNSVTKIGKFTFSGCSSLETINIPNSVTEIGIGAFENCTSLKSIDIPNSVTSIRIGAFHLCTSLESIDIPNSVTEIGEEAFAVCSNLKEINVVADNEYYCSIEGVLFNKDKTTLIAYPAGKSNIEYSIPNSVTNIGNYAFYSCTILESIDIPNSVTIIGEHAFSNTGLKSINIPNSVTEIGFSTFSFCTNLTSVNIPNSVTNIGANAFNACKSLESINIPNSVTNIAYAAFYNCYSLKSINIPNSVTTIGQSAFYCCISLESVTFGESVKFINVQAFDDCRNLKQIYCLSSTPPSCTSDIFTTAVYDQASLYVPVGTKDVYSSTNPWSRFFHIEESELSGVEDMPIDAGMSVSVEDNRVIVTGLPGNAPIFVYNMAGNLVYSGSEHITPALGSGIYIVKAGTAVIKVAI